MFSMGNHILIKYVFKLLKKKSSLISNKQKKQNKYSYQIDINSSDM